MKDDTQRLEALPDTPGNLADADQIRAKMVDELRAAKFAILLYEDQDGDGHIMSVAYGLIGEQILFVRDSFAEMARFAPKAIAEMLLSLDEEEGS